MTELKRLAGACKPSTPRSPPSRGALGGCKTGGEESNERKAYELGKFTPAEGHTEASYAAAFLRAADPARLNRLLQANQNACILTEVGPTLGVAAWPPVAAGDSCLAEGLGGCAIRSASRTNFLWKSGVDAFAPQADTQKPARPCPPPRSR